MPLPWVRLDTTFPSNPKLLAMLQEKDGHRAALLYVCALSYGGAHGTGGFVPREALPFIHGRAADAAQLVRNGFWDEQPGGWLIHDWDAFQESGEETQGRRERAQYAAAKRWAGHEAASGAQRTRRWREQNGDDAGSTVTRTVT